MSSHIPANLGWLRIAVQGLTILAEAGNACSSAAMARELNSNPVFVRRVMAQLVQGHIVAAREGRDGGYCLARPADEITLAEIYQAIKAAEPAQDTTVSYDGYDRVQHTLNNIAAEVEQYLVACLKQYTIASFLEQPPASIDELTSLQ